MAKRGRKPKSARTETDNPNPPPDEFDPEGFEDLDGDPDEQDDIPDAVSDTEDEDPVEEGDDIADEEDLDLAENERDPQPEKLEEELTMAGRGDLPNVKWSCRRITPVIAYDRSTGMRYPCENQRYEFSGQFTSDEAQDIAEDHFGGGIIRHTKYNIDKKQAAGSGKWKFDGLPKVRNIIDTMYGGDPSAGEHPPRGGMPLMPGSPAAVAASKGAVSGESDELAEIEQDIEKEKLKARLEERREKREELMREREERERKRQERERERERREREEEEDAPGFSPFGPAGHPGRRGRFVPGEHLLDPEDRPLTQRELTERFERKSEIDELKTQNRQLMDKIERILSQPKSDENSKMMLGMMQAMQAQTVEMIRAIATKPEQTVEQQNMQTMLLKAITDSGRSERMLEAIIKATGVSDDRKQNEIGNILKIFELARDMNNGGGRDRDENPWSDLLRGGGETLAALAARLLPANPMPQPKPAPQPQAQLPRPGTVGPAAGQQRSQQPAVPRAPLPQGRPNPAPLPPGPPPESSVQQRAPVQGTPVPAVPPAPPAPAGTPAIRIPRPPEPEVEPEEEDNPMSYEEEVSELIHQVIQDMLDESGSKPNNATWVDTAFELAPLKLVREVAQVDDIEAFVEKVRPYVTNLILGAKLQMKIKSDPDMLPWLRDGFEELREMCAARADSYPSGPLPVTPPDPAAVQPGIDGSAPAPAEAQPDTSSGSTASTSPAPGVELEVEPVRDDVPREEGDA